MNTVGSHKKRLGIITPVFFLSPKKLQSENFLIINTVHMCSNINILFQLMSAATTVRESSVYVEPDPGHEE